MLTAQLTGVVAPPAPALAASLLIGQALWLTPLLMTVQRDTLVAAKRRRGGGAAKNRPASSTNNTDFGHYVFSVTSPEGFCNVTAKCKRRKLGPLAWTIHGLWPSNDSAGASPTLCPLTAADKPFSVDELGDAVVERLHRFWPTYIESSNVRFWKYQWRKHGSCSLNHTKIRNFVDYFTTTLDIFSQHNMTKYLENDNIVPRDEPYKTTDFFKAISNDLDNKNINVLCKPSGNVSVAVDIRICLNKETLVVVDCPWRSSSCRKTVRYMPLAAAVAATPSPPPSPTPPADVKPNAESAEPNSASDQLAS